MTSCPPQTGSLELNARENSFSSVQTQSSKSVNTPTGGVDKHHSPNAWSTEKPSPGVPGSQVYNQSLRSELVDDDKVLLKRCDVAKVFSFAMLLTFNVGDFI